MIPATRPTAVRIRDRTIHIEIPADPERLLQDAVQAEAEGIRNADAYWGLLWDAAPRTADLLLSRTWPGGLHALELGCGIGLTGIAGLLAGLQVTFSDLVPSAVQLAQRNAALSGFPAACGLVLDWREPPDQQFDLLIASDVLYDAQNHLPLLKTLDAMLAADGTVWIGDAGRANLPLFIERARSAGWNLELFDQQFHPVSAPTHVQFQLLILNRCVTTESASRTTDRDDRL